MSRAEKFIEEHTKNCSNSIQCYDGDCNPQVIYKPWLTPDQTRRAVEIAREEVIENIIFYIKNMVRDITFSDVDGNDNYDLNKFIEDLKQVIKDE